MRHGLSQHMKVFSHSTRRERFQLFQLATHVPRGGTALEIGSHIGSSALFLCAGLNRGGGHLFCVDTWSNETMPDGVKDTFAEFRRNTERFTAMITPVRKRSERLQPTDCGTRVDLVFIDGDHSEMAVRADLKTVGAWVPIGGRIAFHDVSDAFPGVGVVIGEALASSHWRLEGLVDSLGWIRRVS